MDKLIRPHRFGDQVFVPIVVGAVGMMVEAPCVEMDPSDDLDVLRHCIALALQT